MENDNYLKSRIKLKNKKLNLTHLVLEIENSCQKECLNFKKTTFDTKEKKCLLKCISLKIDNSDILELKKKDITDN